jgi:hypothetical protein
VQNVLPPFSGNEFRHDDSDDVVVVFSGSRLMYFRSERDECLIVVGVKTLIAIDNTESIMKHRCWLTGSRGVRLRNNVG